MDKNAKTSILLENRKRLINDINILSAEICKLKNRLIKIKTDLHESVIAFGNYCVKHLQYDSFDCHYATKKIESIKYLQKDNVYFESLVCYKEREREKLLENLKGINDFLCLH